MRIKRKSNDSTGEVDKNKNGQGLNGYHSKADLMISIIIYKGNANQCHYYSPLEFQQPNMDVFEFGQKLEGNGTIKWDI